MGWTLPHELVHIGLGRRSRLTVVVAMHSTVLGPALGGFRMKPYPTWQDGLADALALSAAMTDKCSVAGLDHGGGKMVAVLPPGPLEPARRTAVVEDVADAVAALGGRYVTGPDIGTGPADMAVIHARTGMARCRPTSDGGAGDSAGPTARGVLAAMTAGARHLFGDASLRGRRIGLIGMGSVGTLLAERLVERGAHLTVTDVDPGRSRTAAALGARWAEHDDLLTAELDVLVPAAVGGLLTDDVVDRLRCRLIVGPANNQLSTDAVADRLGTRGIAWVPDVIAGAGGVVHAVAVEEQGFDERGATVRVDAIGDTVTALFERAEHAGTTLAEAARVVSRQRIEQAGSVRSAGRSGRGSPGAAPS